MINESPMAYLAKNAGNQPILAQLGGQFSRFMATLLLFSMTLQRYGANDQVLAISDDNHGDAIEQPTAVRSLQTQTTDHALVIPRDSRTIINRAVVVAPHHSSADQLVGNTAKILHCVQDDKERNGSLREPSTTAAVGSLAAVRSLQTTDHAVIPNHVPVLGEGGCEESTTNVVDVGASRSEAIKQAALYRLQAADPPLVTPKNNSRIELSIPIAVRSLKTTDIFFALPNPLGDRKQRKGK